MKRYEDFDKKALSRQSRLMDRERQYHCTCVGKSYILKDFIERHSQEEDINVIYVDKEKKAFKNIKTKEDLDTILRAFICQESIIVSWLTRFNRLKGLKKASAFGTPRIILM